MARIPAMRGVPRAGLSCKLKLKPSCEANYCDDLSEDHEGRKASETAGNEIEPLASGGGAYCSGRVICPNLAAQRRSIRLTICCGNLISSIVIAPF